MPAFEWVHVQLHQQKGMISLSPPTICNSARQGTSVRAHRSGADRRQAIRPRCVCRHRGRHVLGFLCRERHRGAEARATR
ncbi:hypothetical protein ACIN7338_1323 [Acinetobacter baumannii OIFC338]|nr:hypothetical protein ACIN7338_1323 [Acinetobacter baumannii OIFC338]